MAGNLLVFKVPLLDRVGVEEEFKVHLDIGDQQFACLEGWQMGTNDESVPMFAQQPAGQGSQLCVPTPIRIGGGIRIGSCGSHDWNHIELIDPTLRG